MDFIEIAMAQYQKRQAVRIANGKPFNGHQTTCFCPDCEWKR